METGGAVELGGVKVLGLNLNLGQLLNVAQVLVPVVKSSSVQGFRTGMAVKATGTDFKHETGFAGGYVATPLARSCGAMPRSPMPTRMPTAGPSAPRMAATPLRATTSPTCARSRALTAWAATRAS